MWTRTVALATALVFTSKPAAAAGPYVYGPDERALLSSYASATWGSIAASGERGELPADGLRKTEGGWVDNGLTSPTNVAGYLWSTLAAEDLGLINRPEADRRIGQTLASLSRLERSHGFFFNWYDVRTGRRAQGWPGGGVVRPFLSSVDNGWMAAGLMMVGNARPDFRPAVDALLGPMDFRFFYDPFDAADPKAHPGLLRGGFYADDGTYASFHYGMLNTEPRIATYVGIARGDLPADHYYRMSRGGRHQTQGPTRLHDGVPVLETAQNYGGVRVVPSWDGTMFEALMVTLFVPEVDWAPRSWGRNHPLYVRAQIEHGLREAKLGYWGVSASCDPAGGYRAYGIPGIGASHGGDTSAATREGVVTPHAAFLALAYAPAEAMANLRALAAGFPVYGPYGFYDSVNVLTGQVSDSVLVLDQAMILAAIDGAIGGDVLRRGFSLGVVEATVKPLMASEEFEVGFGAGVDARPAEYAVGPAVMAPAPGAATAPSPVSAPAGGVAPADDSDARPAGVQNDANWQGFSVWVADATTGAVRPPMAVGRETTVDRALGGLNRLASPPRPAETPGPVAWSLNAGPRSAPATRPPAAAAGP